MSDQTSPVFDGLCQVCSTCMFTCDMKYGGCRSCGGTVTSGGYSLCNDCAIKLNTCKACGQSPEEVAAKVMAHMSQLTHIPYMAQLKNRPGVNEGLSRAAILELRQKNLQNLAESIANDFPEVKIVERDLMQALILLLEIPVKNEFELVTLIETKYQCLLIRRDIALTPVFKL